MQRVQSDLRRSEEQIKLKDQEISQLKRKVLLAVSFIRRSSFHFHDGIRFATGQGMGGQEQEPRDTAKKGAAAATSRSRSFRISLQEMSDARTENLRDGG